ncbi:MAG: peptidase U32 family protein [Gammaproteobacteria bacterium]|nr:MAG: peptidase U32 family protein [Gammaproteobacteria bacterium]
MKLVCPAGNLPSLKAAVDNGADAVYIGFRDSTSARHFAGLNFTHKQIEKGLQYARDQKVKVFVAINTYPYPSDFAHWQRAVDMAAGLDVDALILADIGVMDYACERWPELNLHLSVQSSSTSHEAIRFYAEQFGIRRAVIPRVLSLKQVARLIEHSPVPIEVFGFGSLCVMVEGRCFLSSYVTGQGPNNFGACSPASFVRWQETDRGLETRLNEVLIDQVGKDENAGYPTVCKGRFEVMGKTSYAIEAPTSLNTLPILPELLRIGAAAIKIEGRQRSPAYVKQVTRIMREAIDACKADPDHFTPKQEWMTQLAALSEGMQTTLGAYERTWQ